VKPRIFKISVESNLERLNDVEALADKVADLIHFTEEERDSLAIAVTEAVSNAIVHGNKQDQSKTVEVAFEIDRDRVRVLVRDQGEGFNPEEVRNPLDPENLLKESGRGIFILSALMDEVDFDFSGGGTLLTMIKRKKQR
jgi:serine/threonine-protein kinase RsbW